MYAFPKWNSSSKQAHDGQVYYFYSYGTAAWLGEYSRPDFSHYTNNTTATQAAPLIASPSMIVALLSPEVREATSTYPRTNPQAHNTNSHPALEVYFSRCLGFTLLTLGILTVLLTGSVPLSSSLREGPHPPLPPSRGSPLTPRRRLDRQHRPQSALRAPHAHNHRPLPLRHRLLLLRPLDRDGRFLVRPRHLRPCFPRRGGAVVYPVCEQQWQD